MGYTGLVAMEGWNCSDCGSYFGSGASTILLDEMLDVRGKEGKKDVEILGLTE